VAGDSLLVSNRRNSDGQTEGKVAMISTAASGGSIVNISSVAGFVHKRNVPNPAYTTGKFAVGGPTKVSAVQYGDRSIRVNPVHPGEVLTPMLASSLPQPVLDSLAATIPLRRLAQPREVSYLVLFLASDEASYITGAEHLIDRRSLAAAGAARAGQPSTL
jgi:3alpha(or 20beta)-hydroxysteroid dehydrogenase